MLTMRRCWKKAALERVLNDSEEKVSFQGFVNP